MSDFHHSLRFKLALTFAAFGTVISLLLSVGLFFSAHYLGDRLIDETLRAEADDYIARRMRNPASLPPSTLSIQGYVRGSGNVPAVIAALGTGMHEVVFNSVSSRVFVEDRNDERYFLLFNETESHHREVTFFSYLVFGAFIMIVISVQLGIWLAGRVVAPVEELARRVSRASPEKGDEAIDQGFQKDEVGLLARVFAVYLTRMKAFIEREREFTADVSHELRNPLAIVQGAVELMQEEPFLPEKQRERIDRIARANGEMISLTRALLLMAREGSDDIVMQSCDLCELIQSILDMNRSLLGEGNKVLFECMASPQIQAERALLGIVVSNLIRNACIHGASGSVFISVGETSLTVSDTGAGIADADVDRIFQRHFKGAASQGSGIGLALVKRICERYGWQISIDSTQGQGTTARLLF